MLTNNSLYLLIVPCIKCWCIMRARCLDADPGPFSWNRFFYLLEIQIIFRDRRVLKPNLPLSLFTICFRVNILLLIPETSSRLQGLELVLRERRGAVQGRHQMGPWLDSRWQTCARMAEDVLAGTHRPGPQAVEIASGRPAQQRRLEIKCSISHDECNKQVILMTVFLRWQFLYCTWKQK